VLAAAVGLLVIVPALIWGGEPAVEIIVPIAGLVCLGEYAAMAFPGDRRVALGWLAGGSALVYGTMLYVGLHWVAMALALVVMASMAFVALRPGETLQGAADRMARYLLGIGWIGGLLAFLPLLRRLDQGILWVVLVLVIPWAGDTGAYFAGRAFGRHPMSPRVSPKKTWEGFAGGITLSVVGVFIVSAFSTASFGVLECLLLGLVLGAVSVVGDLSESLLKRSYDVKDSGWIMPGHGGLLDRVDSLLFVGPLLYLYVTLVRG
jgi:phosphatidate cytidylyltransferase